MPGISAIPTVRSPRALTPLPRDPSRSIAHQHPLPGSTSVSALISPSMTVSPSTSTVSVSSHLPAHNPSTTAVASVGPSDQLINNDQRHKKHKPTNHLTIYPSIYTTTTHHKSTNKRASRLSKNNTKRNLTPKPAHHIKCRKKRDTIAKTKRSRSSDIKKSLNQHTK